MVMVELTGLAIDAIALASNPAKTKGPLLFRPHWGSLRADAAGGCLHHILPMQVAGGGSRDGWCKKMTVDGVDMQLHCVVCAGLCAEAVAWGD